MIQTFIIAVFLSVWLFSMENIFAQNSFAEQKTQELVASLSKTKYKHKVKGSYEFEHYIDIKSEALVKNNAAEYSGKYESEDLNHRIELRVADGKIEGSGFDTIRENSRRENFSLRDAKIEGALLSAVKVYENGKTEKFEAVFVNRTISEGTNANKIEHRASNFGLGFIIGANQNNTERVFCENKP